MRRVLVTAALVLGTAFCDTRATPEARRDLVSDWDVEIAQAASIGDPRVRLGLDIRGLGGERGPLVNREDVTSGLDGLSMRFTNFIEPSSVLRPRGSAGEGKAATWRRSPLVSNASRLMVGDEESLPLVAVEAVVTIDGFRARVVLDFFYRNTFDRQLEGTFQLRLPDGASPWFLAFGETVLESPGPDGAPEFLPAAAGREMGGTAPSDLLESRRESWTAPREARMAPRERAARSYGETVRRKVDPALLEWAGAGVFSSRVFPLVAGKVHRVVLGYDVDLTPVGDALEYRLDLPSEVPERAATLRVRAASPSVSPTGAATIEGGCRVYRFLRPEESTFRVRVPRPKAALLFGDDGATGPTFAATLRPELPAGVTEGSRRAVFLVDVSLSSRPERMNVWLELIRGVLEGNRDRIEEFAVLFFNVEAFWWREGFTPNVPRSVDGVLRFAERLVLEGATDLGAALRSAANADWIGGEPDLFLLSDGAATWGETDARRMADLLRETCRLFAYRTGLGGTDDRTLSFLARETGGAVFTVIGEGELSEAAVAHRKRPWAIESVSVPGGTDLLLEGRPAWLFPGQTLRVAGRGRLPEDAAFEIALRRGDRRRVLRLVPEVRIESELAPRVYGEVSVAQIEELGAGEAARARAYATHFRVVGRSCSLVMLESEADYERFGIDPGADLELILEAPVSAVVEAAVESRKRDRADAKAGFRARLARMERLGLLDLEASPRLLQAVDELPPSAFAPVSADLSCRLRGFEGVPDRLREMLASRPVDGAMLREEAERRLAAHGAPDALKALSSLVEERPGDTGLLRDLACSALTWGLPEQAVGLLLRAAVMRPFEPETCRMLARALGEAGNADAAIAWFEVALAGRWDGRFGDFRTIAALDYARLLGRIGSGEVPCSIPGLASRRRASLRADGNGGVPDLVVVITWDTDRTDVDLHVIDPNGEECCYNHRETRIGGRMTADVTQGSGPEMFLLPRAIPGEYEVRVKYYASDTVRTSARTRVFATIYLGWGTPSERVIERTVTLSKAKDVHDIAEIRVGREGVGRERQMPSIDSGR